MLSNDVSVVSAGGYNATISWGGKEIKVSELSSKYGIGATRRLWNKLDENNRIKLLKGYQNFFMLPGNLEKHFGSDVRKKMVKFYLDHTVLAKLKEKIGSKRVESRLTGEIKKALRLNVNASGLDSSDEEGPCKDAIALAAEIKKHQDGLRKLIAIMKGLEVKKLGILIYSTTGFAAEQLVGFVTGNIYKTVLWTSGPIAEVINQAVGLTKSAMSDTPSPDKVMKLYNDLQRIYFTGAKNQAEKILADAEKLKELNESCKQEMVKRIKEEKKKKEKKEEKMTKEMSKVQVQPVSVSVSYKEEESPEERERKLLNAVLARLGNIDSEYGQASMRYSREAMPIYKRLYDWQSFNELWKHSCNVGFSWNPFIRSSCPSAYYWKIVPDSLTPDMTLLEMINIKEESKNDLDAVEDFLIDYERDVETLQGLADEAYSVLSGIEGKRRGLINRYQKLLSKYGFFRSPVDIAAVDPLLWMIQGIADGSAMVVELERLKDIIRNSAKNAEKHAATLREIYQNILREYEILSDNLYLSIANVAKAKDDYKKSLENIGVHIEGNRLPKSPDIYAAINVKISGIKVKIKEKRFAEALAKLEELMSMVEKVEKSGESMANRIPYVKAAAADVDGFISSLGWRLVYGINEAVNDRRCGISGNRIDSSWKLISKYTGGYSTLYGFIGGRLEQVSTDFLFTGKLVINASIDLNDELSRNRRSELSRHKGTLAEITGSLNKFLYDDSSSFGKALDNANQMMSSAYEFNIYGPWCDFAKSVATARQWLPPSRLWCLNGCIAPDVITDDNLQLWQELVSIRLKCSDAINVAMRKRRILTAKGARVENLTISGKPYKYPVTIVELPVGQSMTVAGSVYAGVVPDRIEIRVWQQVVSAEIKVKSKDEEGVRGVFKAIIRVQPGIAEVSSEVPFETAVYIRNAGYKVTGKLRFFDSAGIESVVRQFYDKFRNRYSRTDLSGVLAMIDPEWVGAGGYDRMDLEERLQEIFDTFAGLKVTISDLRVTPGSAKFYAVAHYHIKIHGRLAEFPDVRHDEEGDVTDYLVMKDGRLYIKRTSGKVFF